MISLSAAGYAPNPSGSLGFNTKSEDLSRSKGDGAGRHTSQVNIPNATEQELSSAISPVIKSETLQNLPNKNSNSQALDSVKSAVHKNSNDQNILKAESIPLEAPSKAVEQDETDKTTGGDELTEEEQGQVDDLKKRDIEVRAHEQAHAAVGGSYASAPSYEFETGPDNKQYAIGGEVQIDSAPIPNNPKATIEKMDVVIRAALAPAEPSGQDKKVASQAQKNRSEAQADLAKQARENLGGKDEEENLLTQTTKSEEIQQETGNQAVSNNEQIFSVILAYNSASNLGIS